MATLNKTRPSRKVTAVKEQATTNLAGGNAFTMDVKERLVERVLGAFWNENLFYQSGKDLEKDILADIKSVIKTDPEFVLKLAAYARNEMYLRTTPQVLLVVAAQHAESKPFVRRYAPKIIARADELAEVIAFQLSQFGKPIPNSLKRGVADAFTKFDEYQLNKYDSQGNAVKLADVLRLVDRRKNYPVSESMREYLLNGTVDVLSLPKTAALKALLGKDKIDAEAEGLIKTSGVTWETLISKFGSNKENWERVSANMGYMALLRNLRNFEKFGTSNVKEIASRIADPKQVARSKQLPFRFYSALKNTTNQIFHKAISDAFEASVSNLTLDGKSAIIVDLSGSMSATLSDKSNIQYKEIASVLGAVAAKKSPESVVIGFADTAREIKLEAYEPMMSHIKKIVETNVGSSTYAHAAFDVLKNRPFERVILISDMQCYADSSRRPFLYGGSAVNEKWEQYRKANPKAHLFSLDVSAYGTAQLPTYPGNNVTKLFGWSDKLIDFMKNVENKNLLIESISNYGATGTPSPEENPE